MNILRKHRKSNKKLHIRKIIVIIFSLIMTTFAWFAYTKVLNTTLDIHISAWDMQYFIDGELRQNPINVEIGTLFPAMEEQTVKVDIKNNGETLVDLDYHIQKLTILGNEYEILQELPEEGEIPPYYIITTPPTVETDETTGVSIVKGKLINDVTQIPFTLEIEHSAQVAPGGQAYLTVKANWAGDNDELDSKWGYDVGKYFMDNPDATAAIAITLSVDSYQVEQ